MVLLAGTRSRYLQSPLMRQLLIVIDLVACQTASNTVIPTAAHEAPLEPGKSRTPPVPSLTAPLGIVTAGVINVVDGDTIDVVITGKRYRIRYIGVDTPQTVHLTRGV